MARSTPEGAERFEIMGAAERWPLFVFDASASPLLKYPTGIVHRLRHWSKNRWTTGGENPAALARAKRRSSRCVHLPQTSTPQTQNAAPKGGAFAEVLCWWSQGGSNSRPLECHSKTNPKRSQTRSNTTTPKRPPEVQEKPCLYWHFPSHWITQDNGQRNRP
jgi:hypothetical protein